MAAYTTAALISSIERRSFAPTNQLTFTTAELLSVADEEIQTKILPNILAVREEFFVHYTDFTITSGISGYSIPARAVGMIAREVQLLDSNNNVTDLPRIEPENIRSYAEGRPQGFYIKANEIHLYPKPSATTGTLRVYFFLRPGDLVQTSASAIISAIDTATNIITVSSIPNSWATGNTFDLIKKDGGHEYREIDLVSTLVSGTEITLPSLPTGLSVGDYVSLQGTSPLVQLPPDYRAALAQCVAATVTASMAMPQAAEAQKRAEQILSAAQSMITPRIQGEARKILPKNWF